MPELSIEEVLQKFFPVSRKEDWIHMAMRELQGKNPMEALAWRGKDGLLFLPYYDVADVPRHAVLDRALVSGQGNGMRSSCVNLPLINVAQVDAAVLAQTHLNGGADGLCCDLRNATLAQLEEFLQTIHSPDVPMGFLCGSQNDAADTGAAFLASTTYVETGVLFWETVPKRNPMEYLAGATKDVRVAGLVIPSSFPSEEICEALLKGVRLFERFRSESQESALFRSIAFSLDADADLLATIAKFRALRLVWCGIARTYGLDDYNQRELWLHARSAPVPDGDYGPHENMLKGTFAAIGAVTGGCNSLTLESSSDLPVAIRQARNIATILREESYFDRVADPFAGSYTVEAMTHEVAAKAWSLFQAKWRRS